VARVLPYADMDKMLSLSKRRGFIFQSSEIYGGLGSTYDYGPLGVELKRNVKEAWWRSVVRERDDVVGLDTAILMHPRIWEASGHVENFTDPLVECRNCHLRFRADNLDFSRFVVPNLFELYFWDPSTSIDPQTIELEGFQIKVDRSFREDSLIRRIYLKTRHGQEVSPIPASEYLSDADKTFYPGTVPREIDGTGSLFQARNGYTLGVAFKAPYPTLSDAEAICFEFSTPTGPIIAEYYLATGRLTNVRCPDCGGELTEPRRFNLMFRTFMGAVEDTSHEVFLRPETAQGIFVNFKNVLDSTRKKLPFGIAQIGKAFRNEITPGNFTFRTREFEQMEVEFFVKPGTDEEWLDKWVQARFDWYVSYGIRRENLRLRRHDRDELAHYAKDTYDIEYRFPWGWGELEGIADRTDFDLGRHAQFSGQDLTYFDEETRERYLPYVIEPSGGVDRATLAFWLDSYDEEPDPSTGSGQARDATRTVLHLHRRLAPVTLAVLPLSRNEKLAPTVRAVYDQLRQRFITQYDDAQSIGRRYRRQDEIGTPYCVTVDFDTLDDHRVTIRDRDTMHQDRVAISDLVGILQDKLEHGW
jgi:glycyl-tRNA synthetase